MITSKLLLVWGALIALACAGTISVSTTGALSTAITSANPGDIIELAAGTSFVFSSFTSLSCSTVGSFGSPIVVRGLAGSSIEFSNTVDTVEGFLVTGAFWRFENLNIRGTCSNHSLCEHAIRMYVDAARKPRDRLADLHLGSASLPSLSRRASRQAWQAGAAGCYVFDVLLACALCFAVCLFACWFVYFAGRPLTP